jgi:hypothetical protein
MFLHISTQSQYTYANGDGVDLYLEVRILDSEKCHHADDWLHNRVNVFFDLARAKKSWLPLHCLEGYYCGTGLYSIKIIRPCLHHLPAFFTVGCPVAGPTIYQKENESSHRYGRGTPAKLELAGEFRIVQFSSDQPQ